MFVICVACPQTPSIAAQLFSRNHHTEDVSTPFPEDGAHDVDVSCDTTTTTTTVTCVGGMVPIQGNSTLCGLSERSTEEEAFY